MSHDPGREAPRPRRHTRSRSGKGSADLTKSRADAKLLSQKAMLSRALEKANTAVQLDNAQNLHGARLAYSEACELLRQVLDRTTGDEDKHKLEAIRRTYSSRIQELDRMGPLDVDENKALPARPVTADSRLSYNLDDYEVGDELPAEIAANAGYATVARDDSPPRRQAEERSVRTAFEQGYRTPVGQQQLPLRSSFSRPQHPHARPGEERQNGTSYMPPPLKTARSFSPSKLPRHATPSDAQPRLQRNPMTGRPDEMIENGGHLRDGGKGSWLDPIDESGGSTRSSFHSRTSSLNYRHKHFRMASTNTEMEFDTALDAAIDAAYDDSYDLAKLKGHSTGEVNDESLDRVMRKVNIARERVRQVQEHEPQQQRLAPPDANEGFYVDDSSEEEERMLEEMARGYGKDHFVVGQEHDSLDPPPVPRGAWSNSSHAPPVPSAIFSDFEDAPATNGGRLAPPQNPPPQLMKPTTPPGLHPPQEQPTQRSTSAQSVQSRRLSGHNPKQLKIDTTERRPPPPPAANDAAGRKPKSAPLTEQPAGAASREASRTRKHRDVPWTAQHPPAEAAYFDSPPNGKGPVVEGGGGGDDKGPPRRSGSPSMRKLRKNFSSSSLRSMKSRNFSLTNPDDGMDVSPGTPSSGHQFANVRTATMPMPALPTPISAAFRENVADGSGSEGLHLFEDNVQTAAAVNGPDPVKAPALDAPVPLEACPNDLLLRPFWLMRCLYQTLAHPRGGYLSTKLFVPRDVWKIKGVKLKSVEDKIASCDFLTAALLKLAKVDTFDADAVLDEMQALEGALEQVQASLSRKLGNEVGVQNPNVLFKEASNVVDGDGVSAMPRATSITSKSSSFSWRRLRSKNSAMGLSGPYANKSGGNLDNGPKELATMPTLPMTAQPTSRPAKRDVAQAQFLGPNANYMGSLARLFDAAQAVDQIARQVEDPGLRHADKTQVGLELCTRHAAEFFGFYICRFVLADLTLLLDKFIKRGSEWVLA